MKKPTFVRSLSGLVLAVTRDAVVLIHTEGGETRPVGRVPVPAWSKLARTIRNVVLAHRPRTVLVAPVDGVRKILLGSFVELIDELRAEFGFTVVWLPDLVRIAELASDEHDDDEDDEDDEDDGSDDEDGD